MLPVEQITFETWAGGNDALKTLTSILIDFEIHCKQEVQLGNIQMKT